MEKKAKTKAMAAPHFQIRDSIHGVIFISLSERAIIDSLAFLRLRHIKQVGFADFAFPCATHSRYSHSLGAMHVATKIFDRVIKEFDLPNAIECQMRQALRLAALLHDIGHPPLSHTTEMLMPKRKTLFPDETSERKAKHEDFTLKIILDSPLSLLIEKNFSDLGITPRMVASLLDQKSASDLFVVNGLNFTPLLQQIISSEIDADRMDYLLRDSFFCGVNYGKFDQDWLIENLISIEKDSHIFLGLTPRGLFAFEDFLLSRYHMFVSVYLHHTPVIMEKMLGRFFEECPHSFSLPSDINSYLSLTDLDLWQILLKSDNSWAQRIVQKKPYIKFYEMLFGPTTTFPHLADYQLIIDTFKDLKIDTIFANSKGILSTQSDKNPLFIKDARKSIIPLKEASSLFVKYESPAELFRIFIDEKDGIEAEKAMHNLSLNDKV